jgi:hypothetical protein
MVDILVAAAPAVIATSCHPVEQGWTPPLVGHHHRSGGSSPCAGACLGLLLCHDVYLGFLIVVGLCLLHIVGGP